MGETNARRPCELETGEPPPLHCSQGVPEDSAVDRDVSNRHLTERSRNAFAGVVSNHRAAECRACFGPVMLHLLHGEGQLVWAVLVEGAHFRMVWC